MLVVFGHSIILYSHYWSRFPVISYPPLGDIKELINVIQMPLFFAISGYLFNYSINKSQHRFKGFIKNKVFRLLVPFVCILVLYNDPIRFGLMQYDIHNVSNVIKGHLLLNNLYHLWYLPCLFGIFLISLCKLKNWRYELIVFVALMFFSVNPRQICPFPQIFQISNIFQYLIYFYTGYLISRYQIITKFNFRGRSIVAWIVFLSILLLVVLYPSFLNTPLTVLACILAFMMIGSKKNKIIELISINCLGIYLIHEPLCHVTFQFFRDLHPLLVTLINLLVWGGVALLISNYIRNSRFKWVIGG